MTIRRFPGTCRSHDDLNATAAHRGGFQSIFVPQDIQPRHEWTENESLVISQEKIKNISHAKTNGITIIEVQVPVPVPVEVTNEQCTVLPLASTTLASSHKHGLNNEL